ncbi:MAG: hypothetical protein ACFB5Z_20230 [Elainellaceae cyanobacterium]
MLIAVSNAAETSANYGVQSGLCAIALALIHLFVNKLKFIGTVPRSRWLSGASGVSVAYVFVHLLPELSEMQASFSGLELGWLEKHLYIMALIGMTTFYGLERAVVESQQEQVSESEESNPGIYWLHIASFALYNAVIGYSLFHREEPGLASLLVYTLVMGLHFVVNDFGLSQDYPSAYRHSGRWIVAAAIIAGAVVGWRSELSEVGISLLFSFLAGSIVLNVLKEELPEERKSKFSAFALGAFTYTVLLLRV